jgi:hypothetical protein
VLDVEELHFDVARALVVTDPALQGPIRKQEGAQRDERRYSRYLVFRN